MTSKAQSASALGDVRSTSYNAATANAVGYIGTIDDAIAQIRAEDDEVRAPWTLNINRERFELLGFLGVNRSKSGMSGVQVEVHLPGVYVFPMNEDEDDSVAYGAPEAPREPGKWSLAYAQKRWPECFANETRAEPPNG